MVIIITDDDKEFKSVSTCL